MFDKQTEKKLQNALNHIDSQKITQIKKSLSADGDLGSLLGQFDAQKAQKALNALNLGDVNLNGVIKELKQNPDILNELKKNL